jgi:hypothetical protein
LADLIRDKNGSILETKENLSIIRMGDLERINQPLLLELEKAYGQYLFVPYDIPKILPYDIEKFVEYFYSNSQRIGKRMADLSGPIQESSPYVSISSTTKNWDGRSFDVKPYEDIYNDFPEIFEQIHDLLPWVGDKDFKWTMWSTDNNVPLHRDIGVMVDAPISARIKLFDTNPFETLTMHLDPIDKDDSFKKVWPLPIPDETNSFAWNNLRTKHKSIFVPSKDKKKYRKILFIWRGALNSKQQVNQYIDLLDRSIAKYQKETITDVDNTIEDYLIL